LLVWWLPSLPSLFLHPCHGWLGAASHPCHFIKVPQALPQSFQSSTGLWKSHLEKETWLFIAILFGIWIVHECTYLCIKLVNKSNSILVPTWLVFQTRSHLQNKFIKYYSLNFNLCNILGLHILSDYFALKPLSNSSRHSMIHILCNMQCDIVFVNIAE